MGDGPFPCTQHHVMMYVNQHTTTSTDWLMEFQTIMYMPVYGYLYNNLVYCIAGIIDGV